VYAYAVVSNHAHLIVHVDAIESVAEMMQLVSSATAKQYNRRKHRTGPFWEDRYHCTIVQNGRHLWNCLRYVDLNIVRAGVVAGPGDWPWCGYDELTGIRKRYRILNVQQLICSLGGGTIESFRSSYVTEVDRWASGGRLAREPAWTESLAVGDREFVESVQSRYRWRTEFRMEEMTDATGEGVWTVKEDPGAYGEIRGPEPPPNTTTVRT